MEDDMDILDVAQIMSGLGALLTGIGVLWFVTVYKDKQ
jgi:hypothetical protein